MKPNTSASRSILFPLLFPLLAVHASHAATIHLNDPFTDGDRTNGADPLGTAWFLNNTTNASVSVANDTVINSGNAMRLTTANTFRKFYGAFSTTGVTIAQGETLRLSFDYRFHATANTANGFRFGLYNNGGTATTADGLPSDSNDFGYASSTNPGLDSATGTVVQSELDGDAALGGASPSGLVTVGSAGASVNVGTTLPGAAAFSITRNFDDSISLSSSINGQSAATGTILATDTDRLFYTFHQVAIGLGGASTDFSIDNVIVSVIPEPSCFLLSALGLAAAVGRRRRN